MYKISKVIALSEIMEKIEKDNYDEANKMMAVVAKSMKNDKKNNKYSYYIPLKNKKEALLFENYIVDDTE